MRLLIILCGAWHKAQFKIACLPNPQRQRTAIWPSLTNVRNRQNGDLLTSWNLEMSRLMTSWNVPKGTAEGERIFAVYSLFCEVGSGSHWYSFKWFCNGMVGTHGLVKWILVCRNAQQPSCPLQPLARHNVLLRSFSVIDCDSFTAVHLCFDEEYVYVISFTPFVMWSFFVSSGRPFSYESQLRIKRPLFG